VPPRRNRREGVNDSPKLHEIAHLQDLVSFLGVGDLRRREREGR
jgi:hypothetical protein